MASITRLSLYDTPLKPQMAPVERGEPRADVNVSSKISTYAWLSNNYNDQGRISRNHAWNFAVDGAPNDCRPGEVNFLSGSTNFV